MPEPFRILITGSRTWQDKDFIWSVLDLVAAELGDVTIVHGACPEGADAMAQGWVRHQLVSGGGVVVRAERHPADWQHHGRAAGFRRNEEMVRLGADLCLAFLAECTKDGCPKPEPHGLHGASHCADLAERAGIETRRFCAPELSKVLIEGPLSIWTTGPGP